MKSIKDYDKKYGITIKGHEILEDCKNHKDDEIKHLFLHYDPETELLSVICRYVSDEPSESTTFEYNCNVINFAILLTGVINDPRFITANPHKVNNVTAQCGVW